MEPLGASWGFLRSLGSILAHLGGLLGLLGGPSWGGLRLGGVLGSFWGLLGALGQLLEVLEAQKSAHPGNAYFSNEFLHFLRVPEGVLEPLGASWGRLGGLLGRLGGILRPLGAILGPLGASWPLFEASWRRLGAQKSTGGIGSADAEARWRRCRGPSLGFFRIFLYVYP